MDLFTFIVEITKAIAWPVAIVGAVIILRGHIRSALPFLRKFKYKDVEVEFAEQIKELDSEIRKELPTPIEEDEEQATVLDRFIKLAQISPRAAIFEAWREVEAAVINVANMNIEMLKPQIERWKSKFKYETDHISEYDLIRAFERSDLLNPEMRRLYGALRGLRNRAVHHGDTELEVDMAIEYGAMAYRIAKYIKSIGNASNNALQPTAESGG